MRYTVEKTDEFNAWFSTLKDKQAQRSISVRAVRTEQGIVVKLQNTNALSRLAVLVILSAACRLLLF